MSRVDNYQFYIEMENWLPNHIFEIWKSRPDPVEYLYISAWSLYIPHLEDHALEMRQIFISSLPPLVCRRAHVLITLFTFIHPRNRIFSYAPDSTHCYYIVLLSGEAANTHFIFFGRFDPTTTRTHDLPHSMLKNRRRAERIVCSNDFKMHLLIQLTFQRTKQM